MVNMQQLYEEMKAALEYFGVRFADMEQVQVTVGDDTLSFVHNNRAPGRGGVKLVHFAVGVEVAVDVSNDAGSTEAKHRAVTFGGVNFVVPPGFRYVAQGPSGDVYAYAFEPDRGNSCWNCTGGAGAGAGLYLGTALLSDDWRESLIELPAS